MSYRFKKDASVVDESLQEEDSLHLSEAGSMNGLHPTQTRLTEQSADSGQAKDSIARREDRAVKLLKVVVVVLLLVAAVCLSLLTLSYTRSDQRQRFDTEYMGFASKITDTFRRKGRLRAWSSYSLAVAYTSEFSRLNSWPNVTLWDFGRRAIGPVVMADTEGLGFAPLVTNETRAQWEAYAVENYEELLRSVYSGPQHDEDMDIEQMMNRSNQSEVHLGIQSDGAGPYSPVWQTAPYPSFQYSFLSDLMEVEYIRTAIEAMMAIREPVVSRVLNEGGPPQSLVLFPVFRNFSVSSDVVGSVLVPFQWKKFFMNILPSTGVGLIVVLRNTCGQANTFEINGASVNFLGKGDLHDNKYDEDELSCSLTHIPPKGSGWGNFNITRAKKVWPTLDELSCELQENSSYCEHTISVYPSDRLVDEYDSNEPTVYTVTVAMIFVFTTTVFFIYDCLVERRQRKVINTALRSNAIVRSLFPEMVRDRVFENTMESRQDWMRRQRISADKTIKSRSGEQTVPASVQSPLSDTPTLRLKSYLTDTPGVTSQSDFDCEPIAEMFPDTTVMFADISGFTAWSSEREPSQVFVLLETLYRSFDSVANRLGVFKVETIGDCYVAVAGLPDPNEHHAVVMTWFAYECLRRMKELIKELEVSLGPGTSDLSLRVGLHSGPVTAGVLRGEKSRFQLFGDTVNTAARMESTGETNLIHASQETADLLCSDGRTNWVTPREGVVVVKGKGKMQTFWLKPRRGSSRGGSHMDSSTCTSSTIDSRPKQKPIQTLKPSLGNYDLPSSSVKPVPTLHKVQLDWKRWGNLSLDEALTATTSGRTQKRASQKRSRLVDWNVDVLLSFLTKVVTHRDPGHHADDSRVSLDATNLTIQKSPAILEEVTEIIDLPDFENRSASKTPNVSLPSSVRDQLHDYVTRLASMYREIPFHNLEHASHVTMSAVKLMRRIINPDELDRRTSRGDKSKRKNRSGTSDDGSSDPWEKSLHESTFGISSDPLTQFCVIFSALIHDVDHCGVPNAQLVKEQHDVAMKFGEKSAAEQHSVFVAWQLLMEPRYEEFRSCIYTTEEERKRFRQLVVNAVMATDILDRELQNVRKNRWDKAFKGAGRRRTEITNHERNRKATSVIEHIIQASDVAHTMQHWHIFRKWNERLFDEMYIAYKQGRTDKDPSIGWYEGQIGFFDNYIIPLAKKLKDCGVFGVAGNEYLSYALENRREWEMKGREETDVMLVNFNLRYGFWSDSPDESEEVP